MVPKKCFHPDSAKQKQQNIITFPEPSVSRNCTGHVNNPNHTMTMQSEKSRHPEIPAKDAVQVDRGRKCINGLTQ